jgi:hypothetical protein
MMHENYEDIKSRIEEEPSYYDFNGVPRYGGFSPDKCPNIYSRHVGLFRIACQNCGKEFLVEMNADIWDRMLEIPPKKWHYGDPPIHGCIGDTMNCIDLEVIEFWHKGSDFEWTRMVGFEGDCED